MKVSAETLKQLRDEKQPTKHTLTLGPKGPKVKAEKMKGRQGPAPTLGGKLPR